MTGDYYMPEKTNYQEILERARKRKNKDRICKYIAAGVAAAVIVGAAAAGIYRKVAQLPAVNADAAAELNMEAEITGDEEVQAQSDEDNVVEIISAEELEAQKQLAAEKQAVVDSYTNLGLVQVSGYLNIRKEPNSNGEIIGKLQENSACEILGTDGEWYQISSGGVEGYIHSQYLLTGEDARSKALEYVTEMAIISADKLNIRQTPELDPANVTGQALNGERYPVLEREGDWILIEEGYISADYAEVRYALNEARKLDLKAMALNQYDNLVISKVNNYLNIRSSADTSGSSNIIGKFPSKAAGEILETLDGWYKIKSGSITGYITADPQYVAVGQEAKDLALQSATLMAIVNTDMLNVRAEPNTDSTIWTQISKEERYNVVAQLDGWVQIELDTGDSSSGEDGDKAYISTRDNNVDVRYALTEAIKFSPLEEKANQQSSLRSKLVNYALQFVGGRYVWGGTDPHTGADCSGFVQYVYRHVAGVSLPRVSRDQANSGTAVNSSQMQPGDLIFYTNSKGTVNHVAMYIGNGQVVHAASRKSGIKISTWNYRKPKTIRRFLN
jgi:cell wall-associated NlpC family hydrolase/SH3-like domain-containing protein